MQHNFFKAAFNLISQKTLVDMSFGGIWHFSTYGPDNTGLLFHWVGFREMSAIWEMFKSFKLFWSLTKDFFSWLCLLYSETMLFSKSLAKLVQALVQNIFSSHFPSSFCSRIQMTIHETLFCQLISLWFATQANIILKGFSNEYLAGEKASSLAPYVS